MTSKNKYGMVGSTSIYVAVTDIDTAIHLEGAYLRLANLVDVNVSRRANGLYEIDNVGGVASTSPTAILPALFVQVDDTTMSFPLQSTSQGDIYGVEARISMATGDTSFQYKIGGTGPFNANALRYFQKQ
jgi:hypothetical protein